MRRPNPFRTLLPALALLGALPLPVLAADDFSGAWVAWICPSGVERKSGACANFVLELMQRDGKLCGSHMYATGGAERVEEGAAPSLTADLAPDDSQTATAILVSNPGAAPLHLRAELRLDKGKLHWERLDSPPGEVLLPKKVRLTRAGSRTLFAPLFEQELRAACDHVFTAAALQSAPAIPGTRGEGAPAGGSGLIQVPLSPSDPTMQTR